MMKGTNVLVAIAIGAFLFLTTLVAESKSVGILIPPGKRQLDDKVCIHETAELFNNYSPKPK